MRGGARRCEEVRGGICDSLLSVVCCYRNSRPTKQPSIQSTMKTTTTTTTTTGKKPPRAPFPPALCTRRSSARAPTAWRRDYSTASHNLHPRVDSESTAECSSRYRPPTTFPTSRASSVKRQASAVRRQWRARERERERKKHIRTFSISKQIFPAGSTLG